MQRRPDARRWIAVFGGGSTFTADQVMAAYRCGQELARRGYSIVTGASDGVAYAAALGATDEGGATVGISPGRNAHEHGVQLLKPWDGHDCVVYSGLGVEQRGALIVRSVEGAVFIGGEAGTLNEFTMSWMRGDNILAVLEGVGGISDAIRALLPSFPTSRGSEVLFGGDPAGLVAELADRVDRRLAERPLAVGPGQEVRALLAGVRGR